MLPQQQVGEGQRGLPIGIPSADGKFGRSTPAPRGAVQNVERWKTHGKWQRREQ